MTLRVIVCDDQPLVRRGFSSIIDAEPDMSVVGQATDGRGGLTLAARLQPDIAVVDIRMPHMDGLELTRRLAGPHVERATKVLVVTTFHVDHYVYDALRAGASGFVLKDIEPEKLVEAVRTVARGDALLSPAVTRQLLRDHATRLKPPARADAEQARLSALTTREREVLERLAHGWSNPEIAQSLGVSAETVKSHVSNVLAKLELRNRMQAVVFAYRVGLVAPE